MFLHLSVSHSVHWEGEWGLPETPCTETPLYRDPPCTETPWTGTLGQRPPGQRPPEPDRYLPWTETHLTGMHSCSE